MTISFFLIKIYEEYYKKNINNLSILETCLMNYNQKHYNIDLLYFAYKEEILIEILYNSKSNLFITSFSIIDTTLTSTIFVNKNIQLYTINNTINKLTFWQLYMNKFNLDNTANIIHDSYILDMLIVELKIRESEFTVNELETINKVITDLIDNIFIEKNLILFLLQKQLLLEFFLNLLDNYLEIINTQEIICIENIYNDIKKYKLTYPKYTKNLLDFWFNINEEYLLYKQDKLTYFYKQ